MVVSIMEKNTWGAGFFLPFFLLVGSSIFHFSVILNKKNRLCVGVAGGKPKKTIRAMRLCVVRLRVGGLKGHLTWGKGQWKENSVWIIHLELVYTTVILYCLFTATLMTETVLPWLSSKLLDIMLEKLW